MSKKIKPSVLSLAIAQAIAVSPSIQAETINLGNGCTLVDAITSANTDTETGGCIAGDGADVINLEAGVDVVLDRFGTTPNGLPVITSEVTINGGGAAIERDISNPDKFRLMEVSTASGMLTLNSVTLANGYAYSGTFPEFHGGGIYLNNSASLVGNSLTLSGNRAKRSNNVSGNGGGINATGATVELNDSLISNNNATSNGGAVYVYYGSLTLNETVVSNNTAATGAGVAIISSPLVGDSATISNNSTSLGGGSRNGGGIWAFYNSTVELSNSTIENNYASSAGGGIRSDFLSPITLINTHLNGNEAGEKGGGLYARKTAVVSVSGGSVSNNTAGSFGGAMYARYGSTITLEATIVSGNTTSATTGSRYAGGVLLKESASLTSSDTLWSNNHSLFGGAIATRLPTDGVVINIDNDTFIDNSTSQGGALRLTFEGTANISNSSFSQNYASGRGGAIANMGSFQTTVRDTTLFNNSSVQGAAFFNSAELTVINSTISSNSASNAGGGFSHSDNHTKVINSTLTGNEGMNFGGGIVAYNAGSVSLYNSIVAGNIAPLGAEISDAGSLIIAHANNLLGSSALNTANALNGFTPSGSDILATNDSATGARSLASIINGIADNGGPTLTHALAGNSPAIDRGNQALCVANNITQDQRGVMRDDGRCDIGAVEAPPQEESCFVVKASNGNTLVFCL